MSEIKIEKMSYKHLADLLVDTLPLVLCDFNYKIVGKKVIIPLDNNRNLMLWFCDSYVRGNYNCIDLAIIDKNDGVIARNEISFSDCFDNMQDQTHPNKIGKHIWTSGGKYSWYGMPTTKDIRNLNDQILDYISVWK